MDGRFTVSQKPQWSDRRRKKKHLTKFQTVNLKLPRPRSVFGSFTFDKTRTRPKLLKIWCVRFSTIQWLETKLH